MDFAFFHSPPPLTTEMILTSAAILTSPRVVNKAALNNLIQLASWTISLVDVVTVVLGTATALVLLLVATARPKGPGHGVSFDEGSARSYIRQAAFAGLIMVSFSAIASHGTPLEVILSVILPGWLTIGTAFGRRIHAIALLTYSLVNAIGIAFGEDNFLGSIVGLTFFGPFLYRGIRGSFALHRIRHAQGTASPPTVSGERSSPRPVVATRAPVLRRGMQIAVGVMPLLAVILWLANKKSRLPLIEASLADVPVWIRPERLDPLLTFFSTGFGIVEFMWLAATLIVLGRRFDPRLPKLRAIILEALSMGLSLQAITATLGGVLSSAQNRLPAGLRPLGHRLDELWAHLSISSGAFLFPALVAPLCARLASPSRTQAEPPLWLYALLGLPLIPVLGLDGALLTSALILLIRTILLKRREGLAGLSGPITLAASIVLTLLVSGSTTPLPRLVASSIIAGIMGVIALDSATNRDVTPVMQRAPAVLDGKPCLSPFIIPNEARLRVFAALLFGTLAFVYHAQIVGAVIARWIGGPFPILSIVDMAVIVALVLALVFIVLRLGRPTGELLIRYVPGHDLKVAPPEGQRQFYDDELIAVFKGLITAWRPARAFSVYRTRGQGTPMTGWARGEYIIDFPSRTLRSFFDHDTREASDEVRALCAHELAHVVHGDPLPLALASAVCIGAVALWLPSGILLALSPLRPGRAPFPIASWEIWMMMTVVALVSFGGLLRSAQRKIELLADARAALHLGSLDPVRRMVKKLLDITSAAHTSTRKRSTMREALRLGATSNSTLPRSRLLSLFDTHHPLTRRLEAVSRGMHALNTPDTLALALVPALSWIPLLLSEEIALGSRAPELIGGLVATAALGAFYLEYFLQASTALSPLGEKPDPRGARRMRLWSTAGSVLGLLAVGAVLLPGLEASRAGEIWRMLSLLIAVDPSLKSENIELLRVSMLIGYGMLATLALGSYIVLRLLILRQLQRIARLSILALPQLDPTFLALLPFALGLFLYAVAPIVLGGALRASLSFPVVVGMSQTSQRPGAELSPMIVVALLALGAAFIMLIFSSLGAIREWLASRIKRKYSCCSAARPFDEEWVFAKFYEGCPSCGVRLSTLESWTPADMSASPAGPVRRVLPWLSPAFLILCIAIPDVNALSQFLLQEPQRLDEAIHQALRANLQNYAKASISDIVFDATTLKDEEFLDAEQLRISRSIRADEPSPEAKRMDKMLRPYRQPMFYQPLGTGVKWLVMRTMYSISPEFALSSQHVTCPLPPLPQRAGPGVLLLHAICALANGDGEASLEALRAYSGETPRDPQIGYLYALAALQARQPTLAVREAAFQSVVCRRDPSRCQGLLPEIFAEVPTLALTQVLKRSLQRLDTGAEEILLCIKDAKLCSKEASQMLSLADLEPGGGLDSIDDDSIYMLERPMLRAGHDPSLERELAAGGFVTHLRAYQLVTSGDIDAKAELEELLREETPAGKQWVRRNVVLPNRPIAFIHMILFEYEEPTP